MEMIWCCGASELRETMKVNTDILVKRTFKDQEHLCKVVKIYDGDTADIAIRFKSNEPFYLESIRFLGIDAPEIKPTIHHCYDLTEHELAKIGKRKCAACKLHSKAAKMVRDVLLNKMPEGSVVKIKFPKTEDKYGRLLGELFLIKNNIPPEAIERCMLCIDNNLDFASVDISVSQWLIEQGLVFNFSGTETKKKFTKADLNKIIRKCEHLQAKSYRKE